MEISSTPRRPASHIAGDVAQSAVAFAFQEWGWTGDRISSDYGEDLDCTIFIDNQRTGLHFRCQVKSLGEESRYVKTLSDGTFSVRLKTSTCKAWLLSYFPVLLVVYDPGSKISFWTNATMQIRENLSALSQRTMTLRVRNRPSLQESRQAIICQIQSFYAGLLRLSSPTLECEVFPLLMPGYRALPYYQVYELKLASSQLALMSTPRHIDSFPAWGTSLHSLQGPYLLGWRVTSSNEDLKIFLEGLKETLGTVSIPLKYNEWLSFVCSPIEFTLSDEEKKHHTLWKRALTDWWSYAYINSNIVADHDYAYMVPNGYVRQIGRRARSWETFHHVDPVRDVSIQLFASASTTPGYRAQVAVHRQHMLGQFLPWTCAECEVTDLRALLAPLELVFRRVDGMVEAPETVLGAICTVWFEPLSGLFGTARDWEEFVKGSVRNRLENAGILSELPGRVGSSKVTEHILSMFGDSMKDPPEQLLSTERHFTPGLPLDHSRRMVCVQRFREVCEADLSVVRTELARLKERLQSLHEDSVDVQVANEMLHGLNNQIIELSVSWTPPLRQSSVSSHDRLITTILEVFDRLLPRRKPNSKSHRDTFDILRFEGELYFEGDRLY
jgi:hypothetical protein